jgi:hypothetical protein
MLSMPGQMKNENILVKDVFPDFIKILENGGQEKVIQVREVVKE